MSGVTLGVQYKDDELKKRIRSLKKALSQDAFGPLLDEIGETVKTQVFRRFETGTDPEGQHWPQSLRARLENGQTLVDTGRLRDSITYAVAIDKSGVEVGTNVVYAAIHQTGGVIRAKSSRGLRFQYNGQWATKQSVTLPARPFLGISAQDEDAIRDVIEDWANRITQEVMAQ